MVGGRKTEGEVEKRTGEETDNGSEYLGDGLRELIIPKVCGRNAWLDNR